MNRLLTFLVAALASTMIWAEGESSQSVTIASEQSLLDAHKPLVQAPSKDEEKNVKYWANTVASRLKVSGYGIGGYSATFPEEGQKSNSFNMKLAILMVGAEITPHFYAFFMHEFKTKDMQEYYVEYRPFKALNFRLGQSKTEFSIENCLSPTVLESTNFSSQAVGWLCGRDPLISNGSGRDMGLTIYGNFFKDRFRYVAEVKNGGQINTADHNNQKNFIAKLEYMPIPNWRISVSGQKGYGYSLMTSAYNPTVSLGKTYRQDRYAFGAEWKSKKTGSDYYRNRCASIRAEVLGGRDGKCNSIGSYISSAIPVYKGLDVVAIADYMNYNTENSLQRTDLIAGVQYWVYRRCRLQAQYAYSIRSTQMRALEGSNAHSISVQAQMRF